MKIILTNVSNLIDEGEFTINIQKKFSDINAIIINNDSKIPQDWISKVNK